MKRILSWLLVVVMVLGFCPQPVFSAWAAETDGTNAFQGKTISILGDSISTFDGYIPVADGFNLQHLARYPQADLLTDVNETWWMQVIDALDARLGINDSWRGATCSGAHPVTTGTTGANAAMGNLTRIQNLGSNGTPDVILFYGGTNDLAHVSKVGTFDPEHAPTAADLVTKQWDNLADGYVNTLLRLRHYYPDAEILCLLPTYTASYYSNEKLAQGNAVLAAICQHYGVAYTDLRECGITTGNLPDGIHPDEAGMDYISQAAAAALLAQCQLAPGATTVYPVTQELEGVTASQGHIKGITVGKPFTETLTGENMTVTVTMGGVDITTSAWNNGLISIEAVTGPLQISARGDKKAVYADHLQQLPDSVCGNTDLWKQLEHDAEYYTASGWGIHATGKVRSVTIPVLPGQQLWATSFQAKGANGGTLDGIRVTWFGKTDVLKSVTNDKVYEEFAANGYLTAPEGAFAVSIPMWTSGDENELYLLSLDHSYESGVCTGCGGILPAASIGESLYPSLTAALAAAESGDTIILLAPLTEVLTIHKAVVLDVNGMAVTGGMDLAHAGASVRGPQDLTITTSLPGFAVDYAEGVYRLQEKQSELFRIDGASMTLGNSLAINFFIDPSDLEAGESYYALITKEYADGRQNVVETVPQTHWGWHKDYGQFYAAFNGVAAKEMCDKLTVIVYNSEGQAVSEPWIDSVQDYTMRVLEKEAAKQAPDPEKLALYVDMLNYGAAAQIEFRYDMENLANSRLTDAQKQYATQDAAVTMDNHRLPGPGYSATNLTLESDITMNFFFLASHIPNEHSDFYAIATFTDHYGSKKEIRIEGEAFQQLVNDTDWYISVKGLVVADCRQLVTVTIYDGQNQALASCVDSIESYVARNRDKKEIYLAILKFGVSAYASFH